MTSQEPFPGMLTWFIWPRIEELPPMPKSKKVEALTAAVMFEQLPPGKLQALVAAATAQGHAVMFGQTRSGKAAIVTIYADDGKQRHFADDTEDLVHTVEELTLDYAKDTHY